MRLAESILMLLLGMQAVPTTQGYPISVSISTPSETVESGAEIRLNIRVTNKSDHVVKIIKALHGDGPADGVDSPDVTYADGRKVPRLPGRRTFLSRGFISVKPGESKDDFLIVSKMFDMSLPGRYSVMVRHELVEDGETEDKSKISQVPSNRISITVTQ